MALDFNIKSGGSMLQADGTPRTWSSSNRIAARHTVAEKSEIEELLSSSVEELIKALPFLREVGDFQDLLGWYELTVSVSQRAPREESEAAAGSQITLSSREELELLEEEDEEDEEG
jgi:hypothetical protein